MNYANIKTYSIENGTGVRVSLFVSGCTHHCKGCFNEEAWDFSYGKPFTKETEDEIIHDLEPDYMAGITLLGGEPMEPVNQRVLVNLLKRIRKELPDKTVWIYTGLKKTDIKIPKDTLEAIIESYTRESGVRELEKKNISLKFRGSENQRIIQLSATRDAGKVILAME